MNKAEKAALGTFISKILNHPKRRLVPKKEKPDSYHVVIPISDVLDALGVLNKDLIELEGNKK